MREIAQRHEPGEAFADHDGQRTCTFSEHQLERRIGKRVGQKERAGTGRDRQCRVPLQREREVRRARLGLPRLQQKLADQRVPEPSAEAEGQGLGDADDDEQPWYRGPDDAGRSTRRLRLE
jgi:hypothetical protein